MSKQLTWGATICTYNREAFLKQCIQYLLKQSRLPKQIVIVDASDYWETTYTEIRNEHSELWQQVELIYQAARVRSLPFQRNQALELSQSDIVFSLDDDIYLYPNAAETIMQGYELDVSESIAMIGAQFASVSPDEKPSDTENMVDKMASEHQQLTWLARIKSKIRQTFEAYLSLDNHFVPYEQSAQSVVENSTLESVGIVPGGLINGGRTTFRRHYAAEVKWSTFLRYYATHEDSDFSYRMASKGALFVAPRALFFHADGNDHPYNRFKVNIIRVSNLMALHRVYSPNLVRSSYRLICSFGFYTMLYLIIDPARRRFSLPVARAYFCGILLVLFYMFYPFTDFKKWYIARQEKLYKKR